MKQAVKAMVFSYFTKTLVFSVILAILVVIFVMTQAEGASTGDFKTFLTGAMIIKNGDARNLYDLQTQINYQQKILSPFGQVVGRDVALHGFPYLPAVGFLFLPFTFFPFFTAYKIYTTILLLALILITFLLIRNLKFIKFSSIWPLVPFLFYPSVGSIFIGQTSVLLVLAFLVVFIQMRSKNYLLAGIAASFLILKIQYIIAIPFFLLLSAIRSEFVKGVLGGFAVLTFLSVLVAGNFWREYVSILSVAQNPEFGLLISKMFTLYATLRQSGIFARYDFWDLFLLNSFIYGLVFAGFWYLKKTIPFERGFSFALLVTLILCVHGVDYDLSILLLPIFIISNYILAKKVKFLDLVFVILITLTPITILANMGAYAAMLLSGASIILIYPYIGKLVFKKL